MPRTEIVSRDAWVFPWITIGGNLAANASSRYMGATTGGSPATGTFAVGDWVVDQSGTMWICTTAGQPGTWTGVGGSAPGVALLAGATFTGPVSNTSFGVFALDSYTGTDDQKMTSALAAVTAAGGGTIQLAARAHTFVNQWATTYVVNTPVQIRIAGAAKGHGASEGTPTGPTKCDMQYAGAGAARMDWQHSGSIEIEHIQFNDTVASAVPFFQTTNAEPNLHDLTFKTAATAGTQFQDAIYMGGLTTTTYTGGDTGAFQAYQGVVQRISFFGIRTGVWCRTYANSISMRDLLFDGTCGAPNLFTVTDGAITAATNTLVCATSTPFTSGMVGQIIAIAGAGADTQNLLYVGRITAFTDSAHVTLSANAVYTVSAATVSAVSQAAIMIGSSATTGGVQGNVIADCCIEVSGYPAGVLLQQSQGNSITSSSFWDGAAANLASIVEVQSSLANTYIVTDNNQFAGIPALASENYGGSNLISPSLAAPMTQFTGNIILNSGGNWIDCRNPSGSGIRFSAVRSQTPTATIMGDTGGNINITPQSGALIKLLGATTATYAQIGTATNCAYIGSLGTADVYLEAGGTSGTANLHLTTSGTGYVNIRKHTVWASLVGIPTIVANANAGTTPTVSVVGNDVRGVITVTTGTGTVAVGALAAITFNSAWLVQPYVVVCGSNVAACALSPGVSTQGAGVFTLTTGFAPALSTTYTFNYLVMG